MCLDTRRKDASATQDGDSECLERLNDARIEDGGRGGGGGGGAEGVNSHRNRRRYRDIEGCFSNYIPLEFVGKVASACSLAEASHVECSPAARHDVRSPRSFERTDKIELPELLSTAWRADQGEVGNDALR